MKSGFTSLVPKESVPRIAILILAWSLLVVVELASPPISVAALIFAESLL